MQRSEVVASGLGPTSPIAILGAGLQSDKFAQELAPLYALQPTVYAHLLPGAVLTWRWEVTSDLSDAGGNWPNPGNWTVYDVPFQTPPYCIGMFCPLLIMITGIRVNVLTYTSGSLAFRVLQ